MPFPALLLMLPAFAAGAAGGYLGKKAEIADEGRKATRTAIIGALTKAASIGDDSFTNDPGLPKIMKQYGIDPSLLSIHAQVAQQVKRRRAEGLAFLGMGGEQPAPGAAPVPAPGVPPSGEPVADAGAISEAMPAFVPQAGPPARFSVFRPIPAPEAPVGAVLPEAPAPAAPVLAQAPTTIVAPTTAPIAAAPAPTGVRGAAAKLPPNVSVTIDPETGDLKFTVRGMTTDEHQGAMVQYLLQQNKPLRDIISTMNASGLAVPERLHEQLGRSESMAAYRRARQEQARRGITGPEADRAASEAALNETGFFNERLPAPFADKTLFAQEALRIAQGMVDANPRTALDTIFTSIRRSHLPLTPEQETQIRATTYGQNKLALRREGFSEPEAILTAAAHAGGNAAPPQELQWARERLTPIAPTGLLAQKAAEKGLSPAQVAGQPGLGERLGREVRTEEVMQTGEIEKARETAKQQVFIRPPEKMQEYVRNIENSWKAMERITKRFEPAFTGLSNKVFGTIKELCSMTGTDEVEFRAAIQGSLNTLIRQSAGMTQTTQEALRVAKEAWDAGLPPHVFVARMNVFFEKLKDEYDTEHAVATRFRFDIGPKLLPEKLGWPVPKVAAPTFKDIAPHIPAR